MSPNVAPPWTVRLESWLSVTPFIKRDRSTVTDVGSTDMPINEHPPE